MQLLHLMVFYSASHFATCRLVGVFDNVTVVIKNPGKTATVVIDFDDNLNKYVDGNFSEIIIRNQFIPKLEANSVTDLANVQNLSLACNGIREIRRGAFKNLPKLKFLNLSYNEIEEIHNGVFDNLSVEDLYLNKNRISVIAYEAFSNLQLRNFFLSHNKISRWSKDWLADSSVLFLDLSYNFIADLPQSSFHLMLKPVNGSMNVILTGNQLKRINNDVFGGFETYQTIFLDSNSIDRLEGGVFNGVKYINTLNLNNNSISEINSDIFRYVQLDVLMVEDNKLRCISTDVFKKMEEIDVDGNPITCRCVNTWLDWRSVYSNPSIYHITNLEQECI